MDIIFLNGASSSGKTSIVKALQNLLAENHLHIGIDKFLGMMPEKSNDWVGQNVRDGFYWTPVTLDDGAKAFKISTGAYGRKINNAYHHTTANLASMGLKLIVDDVTNGNDELQLWKKRLKSYKTIYVGIYCDAEILQIREKARGDRKIGTAIEQAQRVHNNIEYDMSLDTSQMSALDCAKTIISEIKKSG